MGQAFSRLRQITAAVMRHGLGHLLERRRSRRLGGTKHEMGVDLAIRFRNLLEELGPTFIKFGQSLATRGDFLPPEFAQALRGLQDHVAPMTAAEVDSQLLLAFGRPKQELFKSFSAEPIASASIAQVHRAESFAGEALAVKVQRPKLKERITADLDLLQVVAQLCQNIISELGVVAPRDVVDEFADMLLSELDFSREAEMLQRFADNADKPGRTYVVPKPYLELTRGPVLTMQWLAGQRIGDLTPGPFASQVAHNIVQACYDQMFVDGLFHADPHPGNCLVLPDGRLGLIDFGATSRLSHSMRETLVVLVLSIGLRDAGAIARLLYRVGLPQDRIHLASMREAVAQLLDERLADRSTYAAQDSLAMLQALFGLAARFGVRVPSEYALIGRAAVTVEGTLRSLDPNMAVIDQAKPLLRKLIEEQFVVADVGQTLLRQALRARDLLHEVPMAITQVAMDLEHGKLRVQIDNPHLASISRAIDTLGVVVFMGLLAAALVGGSMSMLARIDWRIRGWPVLPLVGLYLASMLFGAALGRWYLAPRWRKVSLGRLFRRRGQR